MTTDAAAYVQRVRRYYDRSNAAYLAHVGHTYQAGLLKVDGRGDLPANTASNLFLAQEAGIQPGDRLLDAGCGICGPAVDIARHHPGITIEALTVSPVQVATARERVAAAGLADRVRVHLHDYHELPFPDDHFDRALFLESAGYAYDPPRLFGEVLRVLRPGGTLYVKDVFRREGPLTADEARSLALMNEAYVFRARTVAETAATLHGAGFAAVRARDLDDLIDPSHLPRCFFGDPDGPRALTSFALFHFRFLMIRAPIPAHYAQIKATKPPRP